MKSQNLLKCSRLLQAYKLVIVLQKQGHKDHLAFSFATKYYYQAIYHQNAEAILFAIG